MIWLQRKIWNYIWIYNLKQEMVTTRKLQTNISSHRRSSVKKDAFKNFIKFIGKYLCWSLFFNKLRPATLLKKRLKHRCFPVNFVTFLRTPFLQNTYSWLLLYKPPSQNQMSFTNEIKLTLNLFNSSYENFFCYVILSCHQKIQITKTYLTDLI